MDPGSQIQYKKAPDPESRSATLIQDNKNKILFLTPDPGQLHKYDFQQDCVHTHRSALL
jgi:hypothetical protein